MLKNLRILALQSNLIEHISGLKELANLEELYLSDNKITQISGLDNNVSLAKALHIMC